MQKPVELHRTLGSLGIHANTLTALIERGLVDPQTVVPSKPYADLTKAASEEGWAGQEDPIKEMKTLLDLDALHYELVRTLEAVSQVRIQQAKALYSADVVERANMVVQDYIEGCDVDEALALTFTLRVAAVLHEHGITSESDKSVWLDGYHVSMTDELKASVDIDDESVAIVHGRISMGYPSVSVTKIDKQEV